MEDKKPISHVSFWGGPDGGMFLGSARITTVQRQGKKVFVRTLRPDEDAETADPPIIEEGEQLVLGPGAISIGVRELDKPAVLDEVAVLRCRVQSGGATESCWEPSRIN